MAKKSQAWGIDLMVAAAIFSMGIISFYMYTLNNTHEAEETVKSLYYDGSIISNSVLSDGYPPEWNSSTVTAVGILNKGKINETKLERFYLLSLSDYEKTKNLFNTRYEYYFFLEKNMTINSNSVEGIGKKPNGSEKNLVKITRFTIYKNIPAEAYLYVWK